MSASVIERFLAGESVIVFGEERFREELKTHLDAVDRLAKTYAEATDAIGMTSAEMAAKARAAAEEPQTDPYQLGFAQGEGYAWLRCQSMLAYWANALKMAEIVDAEAGSAGL